MVAHLIAGGLPRDESNSDRCTGVITLRALGGMVAQKRDLIGNDQWPIHRISWF